MRTALFLLAASTAGCGKTVTDEDCRKVGENMLQVWQTESAKAASTDGADSEKARNVIKSEGDKLVADGALLGGEGLKSSTRGSRVRRSAAQRFVLDGPFTESKELVGGYMLLQVPSLDDAVDAVRGWLAASRSKSAQPLSGATAIMRHYQEFQANLPAMLRAADLEPAELGFFDRANLMAQFLETRAALAV